ncbi:MAG: hypothetical protein CL920_03540 [Deltaproteobacteria bacterium]|nr:hypothetical protein [Deltaproteobacteria bacterium]
MAYTSLEQLLIKEDMIQPLQLKAAQALQKEQGGRIEEILVGMGLLSEEQLLRLRARSFQQHFAELDELLTLQISEDVLLTIPYRIAFQQLILPVARVSGGRFRLVALAELSKEAEESILSMVQCEEFDYILTTRENLVRAIRFHYGKKLRESNTESRQSEARASREFLALRQERLCEFCGYPYEPGKWVCSQCEKELYDEKVDPLVGEQLDGKWQMVRQLGQGGMGLVYEGISLEDGRTVAIKFLRTQFHIDDVALDRFYHEMQVLRRLKHPNIVSVYEFGYEEKFGFFMVMELLRGASFDTFVELHKKQPPLAQICQLMLPVCEAMEHAHKQRIIHRDLKPENIFLLGSPESIEGVTVLDFGIAQIRHETKRITDNGITMGTPQYFSPEQAVGDELDGRSDIYSLAVILFEAVTGGDMYEANSPYQHAMRHVYTPTPTPSEKRTDIHYPEKLEALLADALEKKPEERIPTMAEFKRRLLDVLSGFGVSRVDEDDTVKKKRKQEVGTYSMIGVSTEASIPRVKTGTGIAAMRSEAPKTPVPSSNMLVDHNELGAQGKLGSLPVYSSSGQQESLPFKKPNLGKTTRRNGDFHDITTPTGLRTPSPPKGQLHHTPSNGLRTTASFGRQTSAANVRSSGTVRQETISSALRRSPHKTYDGIHIPKQPIWPWFLLAFFFVVGMVGILLYFEVIPPSAYRSLLQSRQTPTHQTVFIITEPPGAFVWIDGKRMEKTTPLEAQVEPGKRRFRFELKGYQPLTKWGKVKLQKKPKHLLFRLKSDLRSFP